MKTALDNQNTINYQNTSDSGQLMTPSSKENESKNQIPVLNGVRALACIMVLFLNLDLFARHYNIWPSIPSNGKVTAFFIVSTYLGDYFGDSSIIVFFILSSFLLFLPYAKSLLFDSPWPSFRRFYIRRFFRILPGYLVALFLIALLFQPAFLRSSHWHDLWLFLTFRMDFTLSEKLNPPFWTLAIEFQFYLLLPIIAWLLKPIVRHGTVGWRIAKLTFCLLIITAWGLLTRYWGQSPQLDFPFPQSIATTLKPLIYGDKGKYFEVFAIGMLICMVYTYMQNSPLAKHWNIKMQLLSWLMFITGFILLLFMSLLHFYYVEISSKYMEYRIIIKTSFDAYSSTIISYWLEWQALAYAIAYGCCFWAVLYGSSRLKHPFESSVLSRIASISYSLYLWHYPLMLLFAYAIDYDMQKQHWNATVQYGVFWCWTLVVIFPAATMLYHWIEQPGIRLGEWLISKLTR